MKTDQELIDAAMKMRPFDETPRESELLSVCREIEESLTWREFKAYHLMLCRAADKADLEKRPDTMERVRFAVSAPWQLRIECLARIHKLEGFVADAEELLEKSGFDYHGSNQ